MFGKYQLSVLAIAAVAMVIATSISADEVSAQTTVEPCTADQIESSMSVIGDRLNWDSGDSVQIYVFLENTSDVACEISYELKIDETSGLALSSSTYDWLDNGESVVSLVLKSQTLKPEDQHKRFSAEIRNSTLADSKQYRLSGGLKGPNIAATFKSQPTSRDWRDIWVWGETRKPEARLRNCENSTPVTKHQMNFDRDTSITPLSLSFDCKFGYSLLQAEIAGNDIEQVGLRLLQRNSVSGSGALISYAPYFASPADKESGRYTIVFKDLPKDVPGLRLTMENAGDYELVPADSRRPEQQALRELTDAYDIGAESAFTKGYFIVFGVVLFALLWLILIPPRLGGWASQKYQWKLVGLMWTLMSLALIVGTFALVSWGVSSFSSAIASGNSFSTAYIVGSLLDVFGLLILLLFVITVARARLSASSNRRNSGTMLPWWLQNPLRTVSGAPSGGGKQERTRRSGGQTYFGMLMGRRQARRNGGRKNSGQTTSIGWNWVVLLVMAGVAATTASTLLTP